jgi:hypothetical protein
LSARHHLQATHELLCQRRAANLGPAAALPLPPLLRPHVTKLLGEDIVFQQLAELPFYPNLTAICISLSIRRVTSLYWRQLGLRQPEPPPPPSPLELSGWFASLRRLQHLSLEYARFGYGAEAMQALQVVGALRLANCQLTSLTLHCSKPKLHHAPLEADGRACGALAHMHSLQRLDMRHISLTPQQILQLPHATLTHLSLGSNLSTAELQQVLQQEDGTWRFQLLHVFQLPYSTLKSPGIDLLAHLPLLQEFAFEELEGDALPRLHRLPALRALLLCGTSPDSFVFSSPTGYVRWENWPLLWSSLPLCSGLQTLALGHWPREAGLSAVALSQLLEQLPGLTSLHLHEGEVTDGTLSFLRACPQLRSLHLQRLTAGSLSPRAFPPSEVPTLLSLRRLHSLRLLDLFRCSSVQAYAPLTRHLPDLTHFEHVVRERSLQEDFTHE